MHVRAAATAFVVLAMSACATTQRPVAAQREPCPMDGNTTLGEAATCNCANDRPFACEVLSLLLQKEGGSENLVKSEQLRQKACRLGYEPSCARRTTPEH